MDTGVTSDYLENLKEDAQPYKDKILNGHCKSFDEYKHDTGILAGLAMAEWSLHDTIQSAVDRQEVEDD